MVVFLCNGCVLCSGGQRIKISVNKTKIKSYM